LSATSEAHGSLRAVGRRVGASSRKWFIQILGGADWSRNLKRFVQKQRVIDRESDRYVERVADPDTGEVLRDVDEPLSAHRGHGSAKTEPKH